MVGGAFGTSPSHGQRAIAPTTRLKKEKYKRANGAGIGAQHIGGDPDNYKWRVSYEKKGGSYFHTVSSRQAKSSQEAVDVAKRQLGQTD